MVTINLEADIKMSMDEARNAGMVFPAEAARMCSVSRRRIMNLLEQGRMDPFVWTEAGRMISLVAIERFQSEQETYLRRRAARSETITNE